MKRMNVAALVAAAALLLGSVSLDAGATAVYTWYPVNAKVPQISDWLEVTDAAFDSGSMTYSFYHTSSGDSDPGSPIIELDSVGRMLQPQAGDESDSYWYIDANVRFGDYLTGDLWINDGENSYRMSTSGHGKFWTIFGFLSDNPEWGCSDPEAPCSGAMGYWALDSLPPPEPVPEPNLFAAFGVFALGLLGASTARRWRRDHSRQPAARF